MNDHELVVVEAMQKYGDSFVKALAMAFYMADHNNLIRLKKAFPEYWNEYSLWAENERKTNEE